MNGALPETLHLLGLICEAAGKQGARSGRKRRPLPRGHERRRAVGSQDHYPGGSAIQLALGPSHAYGLGQDLYHLTYD